MGPVLRTAPFSIMKFLLVGIVLLASVAYFKAEYEDEIEELTLDEVDLDAGMSGRPRPTGPRPSRPPFVVKCRNEAAKCIKAAKGNLNQIRQCILAFRKCIRDNRPTRGPRPSRRPRPSGRPTRRPKPDARRPVPVFVKCRIELAKCKKAANGNRKEIVKCLLAFPKCIYNSRPSGKPLPSFPPFVIKCENEAANCKKAANGDKKKIIKCVFAFMKCLRSNRPTRGPRPSKPAADEDVRRPRPSGKPRPSRPPFVVKCRNDRAECIKAANGDVKKILKCVWAFRKCIRDNRPTRRPRPSGRPTRRPKPDADEDAKRPRPSGRPRPSRPPFVVKCK